jgi:hypothetical protein
MIFLITLTDWVTITVLIVGLCLAARLGDQAQQQSSYPLTSQPDSHTIRRHSRIGALPGRLRSTRGLFVR